MAFMMMNTLSLKSNSNAGVKVLKTYFQLWEKSQISKIHIKKRENPKNATIVAPVGVSNNTEIYKPTIIIKTPKTHEKIILSFKVLNAIKDITAGIIRKANTRKTPPSLTELVTTSPKSV